MSEFEGFYDHEDKKTGFRLHGSFQDMMLQKKIMIKRSNSGYT